MIDHFHNDMYMEAYDLLKRAQCTSELIATNKQRHNRELLGMVKEKMDRAYALIEKIVDQQEKDGYGNT